MSHDQALFEIDGTQTGDAEQSAPMSGVRANRPDAAAWEGRSASATEPGPGVDRFAETLPVVDPPEQQRQPEWCVDLGARMVTMDTFELWTAIEHGTVATELLVWREGMECWTPIDEVGELAYMIPLATPQPTTAAMPEPGGSDATPETSDTEATTNPIPLPMATPEPPARRGGLWRGGRWIAAGSMIAAGAIAAILLATSSPRQATRVAATNPGTAPAIPVVYDEPLTIPAVTTEIGYSASAQESKVHHGERGQHRLRRGERR